jgi:hypothetical protein
MKKIYFILLLFFSWLNIHAQPWAQPGATWYNDRSPTIGIWGYIKITKTGETIIQGHLCDILEKRTVGYQYAPFYQPFDTVYGFEYTYSNGNIVYHFRNNVEHTLYDFNAMPGNGWTVAACENHFYWATACNDTGSVSVTQTGTVSINGQSLQYLDVVADSLSNYGFDELSSTIIEKIGNTTSFIADYVDCIADANEMYGLRCYFDSSGFYYNTGLATNCDDLAGINENISTTVLNISPNPASTEFQISNFNFQTNDEILLRDVLGKIYFTKKIKSPTSDFSLQTSDFTNGIYFLEIKTKNGLLNNKVMVQH